MHLLTKGEHVVLGDDVYGGTFRLLDKVFKQLGIDYTRVDMTNLEAVERAFTPTTRMLWTETPTNPLLKIADIGKLALMTRGRGVLLAIDNTFATPYLQNPLALGADIVSHSCTKYIGGHSDVVGGALVVNDDELAERLHFIQNSVGAVPAPMDCFLLLRSTKTLHVRMQRHCENAAKGRGVSGRAWGVRDGDLPRPRLAPPARPRQGADARLRRDDHRGDERRAGGGAPVPRARRDLQPCRVIGGRVESLIEHPAIMTHASIPPEARAAIGLSDGLVRFSVGIENVDDLIADIERAAG